MDKTVSVFALRRDSGELIETDETDKIFNNPGRQQTEDYITGRFG